MTPWRRVSFLLLALAITGPAIAVEPGLRNLDVRGLQVGGTTTLTIDGDDLGTAPRLLFPFATKQERKPGGTDKRVVFDVTLAGDVPAGYCHLRIATDGGVSLPIVIGVDALPQRPFAATSTVPVALHGSVSGSSTSETKFTGKAGQKVIAEVEAQRLGSKLRPIVHLYSPKKLQVAWGWGQPSLSGDARLEATLPEDGEYTVAVHDAEYAPPGPSFFRLKIGQWSFIDAVFPSVVGKGKSTVELLGPPAAVPQSVDTSKAGSFLPLDWPREGTWSGPRPFVTVSPHQEIVEQATSAKGQDVPAGRVGISGRLLAAFEEDRYRIPVTPRSKVRLEVFAERLGSPLDVALVVRNEQGNEVARAEDSPGTLDPVLDYTVPDKVTSVVVGVVDGAGRGGAKGVYRLLVEPQGAVDKGSFQLFSPAQRMAVPVEGWTVVPVHVERRGYDGPIALSADGLPVGMKLEGNTIPAGADGALVTVRRDRTAGEAVITTWRGRGENGQEDIVGFKGHPLERLQPWLATEMPIAPTAEKAADYQVDWHNLFAEAGLVAAGKLVLPVRVNKTATPSVVRLTLITAQPPGPNNQPNPNTSLRQEKLVELAANVTEGEVTILVPPQLSEPAYDVTVKAEFLTADKKTPLGVAYAPVRTLPVHPSLVVSLDGSVRVEGKLDPKVGVVFALNGKVARREGLTGDVTLAVTGLPPGGRADGLNLKAAVTEFTVNVILPAGTPPGEVKARLAASAPADPKQPNVRVTSQEIDFALLVPQALR